MKILVTGGAGYIGSHTAHQLIEAGHEVLVLDNLYSGFEWAIPKQAGFVQGSIADTGLVSSLLPGVDAIIHFAAHLDAPESVSEPLKYYRNNVAGSLALIQAAHTAGIRKFIFSSTAAVYGNPTTETVTEESPTAPLNPYGWSKRMTEQVLLDLAATSAFRCVILRYFNVAGARPDLKIGQATHRATHLIKVAVETALGKRGKMSITGTDYPTPDGSGIRDYIHVDDLASAHVRALDYLSRDGKSDIFNCGYGRGFSVREVVSMVKKVSGVDFLAEEAPRRPGDCARVVADCGKIKRTLDWTPKYDSLELICKTALDWEKKLSLGLPERG